MNGMNDMQKIPIDKQFVLQTSDKYCAAALICLSVAIFTLSVPEFLVNPATAFGIVIACIGVLLMGCTIYLLARYNRALKKEQERRQS
jgi:positive regulator of sigma E activity